MTRVALSERDAKRRLRGLSLRLPTSEGTEPAKAPRRPFAPPLKAAADLEAMHASGWRNAEPRHLVALYAFLHVSVYGVEPTELIGYPLAWLGAVSAATKLLREEFDDEPTDAVEWIRWVWMGAERREKRSKNVGETNDFRIGWKYMFAGRGLVVDYRRAMASKRERAGR